MQKILSIVWYKVLPPVFGGQKGIAGFNQHLSKHYPLICLCSSDNEPADTVSYSIHAELPKNKTQFLNPLIWQRIKSIAKKESPSFIIAEHPYHGYAAVKAKKAAAAKLIVHSHNIESERFRQLGKWWWRILSVYEKWVHRKADLNLFKTDADKELAILRFGLDPAKCIIVPYGIGKPCIDQNAAALIKHKHSITPAEKIILFAGTLDYAPNAEAVRNIYHKIIPALEKTGLPFRIIICGRNRQAAYQSLSGLSHPSVIQAGEVINIETYLQAADVFINPVLAGGGIQTKNIDAIANHCPVVCFEARSAGIPAELCGANITIIAGNDWEAFVHSIAKATQHKEKTPDAFFAYFDWENCIHPLLEKLKTL